MAVHKAFGSGVDKIFGEVVFGSIGLAVIAATTLTLASISDSAIPDAAVIAESAAEHLWANDEVMHLVDVSAMVAPELNITADPTEEIPEEAPAEVVRERLGTPEADHVDHDTDPPATAADPPSQPAKTPKAVVSKPAKGRRCTATPDPAIRSTTPDTWIVERSVIQRYTRDWSQLNELGWSKTHKGSDGRADGMEINGVRCGSDLHDAGLRSGDVIHTVNGRKIHNIPAAIMAYTALFNDRVFSVVLTRRGEQKTMTYRLRG